MKILILQFASIGDVVLASPVVRCLKQQLPAVTIHFGTRRAYQPIVAHNPHIAAIHTIDEGRWQLIRELRAQRFDYVIDLQNTTFTSLIKLALGVRYYSVDRQTVQQWLYVRCKVQTVPEQHSVDRFLATVRPLGVQNDGQGLDYFIPYKDQVETDWLPTTHQAGFVAYALGGRQATKRLPVSRMIELCRKMDYPVVLLGDATDQPSGEAIVRALGADRVYNACGLFNLNQSASLIQRARVVFSHDTGLMHIAAAFGRKVYSIWGSSTPQLGYYPYKTPHVRWRYRV